MSVVKINFNSKVHVSFSLPPEEGSITSLGGIVGDADDDIIVKFIIQPNMQFN